MWGVRNQTTWLEDPMCQVYPLFSAAGGFFTQQLHGIPPWPGCRLTTKRWIHDRSFSFLTNERLSFRGKIQPVSVFLLKEHTCRSVDLFVYLCILIGQYTIIYPFLNPGEINWNHRSVIVLMGLFKNWGEMEHVPTCTNMYQHVPTCTNYNWLAYHETYKL